MKNMKRIAIIPHLDKYINQKCIKADLVIGSILYLYFGDFVLVNDLKKHPKSGKIHLTTDFKLTSEWRWVLYENKRIIASSRMSNDSEYYKAQEAIRSIQGKKLLEYNFNSKTNELDLFFEDGISLRNFNDVVPGMASKSTRDQCVFIAWGPTEYFACYTDGKIENKSRTVTYVHDYAERKEEYRF